MTFDKNEIIATADRLDFLRNRYANVISQLAWDNKDKNDKLTDKWIKQLTRMMRDFEKQSKQVNQIIEKHKIERTPQL